MPFQYNLSLGQSQNIWKWFASIESHCLQHVKLAFLYFSCCGVLKNLKFLPLFFIVQAVERIVFINIWPSWENEFAIYTIICVEVKLSVKVMKKKQSHGWCSELPCHIRECRLKPWSISVQGATFSRGRGSQSYALSITYLLQKLLISEFGFPPESLSVSGLFRFRCTLVTTIERGQTGTYYPQRYIFECFKR